ncbi:hypothetical protein D3C87_1770150 [compost metagenome]
MLLAVQRDHRVSDVEGRIQCARHAGKNDGIRREPVDKGLGAHAGVDLADSRLAGDNRDVLDAAPVEGNSCLAGEIHAAHGAADPVELLLKRRDDSDQFLHALFILNR